MERRPDRERHALVGDFLGQDVLEQVRLVGFPIEPHEVGAAERPEALPDLVQRPQLGVDVGQGGSAEHATDDARDLQGSARDLGDDVDPAEDQAVQALGQLQPGDRAGVGQVDALAGHEVDQLLDVERIAVRPLA